MIHDIVYEHGGGGDDWLENIALVSSMSALEPSFEVNFSSGIRMISPLVLLLVGTFVSVGTSGIMSLRESYGDSSVGFEDTLLIQAQDVSISEEVVVALMSRSNPDSRAAPVPIPLPSRQSDMRESRDATVIVDGAPTTSATSVPPDGASATAVIAPQESTVPVRPNPPVVTVQ